MLNLKYWCDDENEKQRLMNIYSNNEKVYNDILDKEAVSDVVFKIKKDENKKAGVSNVQIIEYKK